MPRRDTRFLVLEFSARGVGHIAYLCGIAPPRIGVVLNVGAAHLGEFGSRAAVAQAKGELVEALPANGLAVLNADDERVAKMRSRTSARVVTFGTSPAADVRADDVELDDLARPSFRLSTSAGSCQVRCSCTVRTRSRMRSPLRQSLSNSEPMCSGSVTRSAGCDS